MLIIERECLVWDCALARVDSGGKDCERKVWIFSWRALTRDARSRSGDMSGEGEDALVVVFEWDGVNGCGCGEWLWLWLCWPSMLLWFKTPFVVVFSATGIESGIVVFAMVLM